MHSSVRWDTCLFFHLLGNRDNTKSRTEGSVFLDLVLELLVAMATFLGITAGNLPCGTFDATCGACIAWALIGGGGGGSGGASGGGSGSGGRSGGMGISIKLFLETKVEFRIK